MKTCPHCRKTTDECACRLLICHTCEVTTKREHRVVETADSPAWNFRRQHEKCAREGWGTTPNW